MDPETLSNLEAHSQDDKSLDEKTDHNRSDAVRVRTANDFPDGGLQAWMVVAGGFCAVFSSFGWINCIGVFQNYYEQNQLANYPSSTIAWIPSTESFMLFFCGPAAGAFNDNYGPRGPILLGTFLHVFGLMMTSLGKEYYQIFLSQSIVSAIGCSFLFYPSIAATGTWFLKHRALAFGIITAGSSIGGVILPIMVNKLIPEVGFGWAMRITAFLILGLLVFSNLTIKSRLPPPKRRFLFKDFVTPFSEKAFSMLAIGSFLIYIGGFLPFNFLIAQALEQGMSENLAGYLVPILNAASTFGRIIPAHFGDTYGTFNVMIILTTIGGVITLGLWLPGTSNGTVIVFAVVYGFASGCTFSIIPAMIASLSRLDVSKLGTRTGALYAFSSIGVLVGSPIGGAIVGSQNGSYSGLKIFAGVTVLAGVGIVIISRTAVVGIKFKVKV